MNWGNVKTIDPLPPPSWEMKNFGKFPTKQKESDPTLLKSIGTGHIMKYLICSRFCDFYNLKLSGCIISREIFYGIFNFLIKICKMLSFFCLLAFTVGWGEEDYSVQNFIKYLQHKYLFCSNDYNIWNLSPFHIF